MDKTRLASELVRLAKEIMSGEDDKCGEKGCIRQVGDSWRVMSGKTGEYWPAHYNTREEAENALKRYHGWGF